MKIESINSSHLLYKGSVDNSKKNMEAQEAERLKTAIDKTKTTTSLMENKGVYFDSKA